MHNPIGFINLPAGFVPIEDQGHLMVSAQLPDAASLQRTSQVVEKITRQLEKTPGVADWISIIGFSMLDGSASSNGAAVWIILDPWDKRTTPELSQEAVLASLMRGLSQIQDASLVAFPPPPIDGLGNAGGFQMELQDRAGGELNSLQQMAYEVVADASPQSGLSRVLTTFRAKRRDIANLEVRNANGDMVPLGTLVSLRDNFGPQIVRRNNLYPSAAIQGGPAPGFSSGQALELMESLAGSKLGPSYGFEWTGMSYQEKTLGVLPLVVASGAGAASRQAVGIAVFGGMLAATFFSVAFVPVFYVVIQSISERLRGKRPEKG